MHAAPSHAARMPESCPVELELELYMNVWPSSTCNSFKFRAPGLIQQCYWAAALAEPGGRGPVMIIWNGGHAEVVATLMKGIQSRVHARVGGGRKFQSVYSVMIVRMEYCHRMPVRYNTC